MPNLFVFSPIRGRRQHLICFYQFIFLLSNVSEVHGIVRKIAKSFIYYGYASGYGDKLSDHTGPQVVEICGKDPEKTWTVNYHDIPEWKLANECAVYGRPGDDTQVPIIINGGNACSGANGIGVFMKSFVSMYPKTKLPTIYSMNYGGRNKARESTIIENAVRLIELVYTKHRRVPHIIGASLGCAVAIGAIERLGSKYRWPSLTLVDPFTNVLDTVRSKFCGGIAANALESKGTNNWKSYSRVQKSAVFKTIPTMIFSATKDRVIPPIQHCKLFSAFVGHGDFSESETGLKFTERRSNLGVPRFLVQVDIGHMQSARRALMQGMDHFDRALVQRVHSTFKRYVVNGKSPVIPQQALVQPMVWRPDSPNRLPGTMVLLAILCVFAFALGALFYLVRSRASNQPRDQLRDLEEGRSRKKSRRKERSRNRSRGR